MLITNLFAINIARSSEKPIFSVNEETLIMSLVGELINSKEDVITLPLINTEERWESSVPPEMNRLLKTFIGSCFARIEKTKIEDLSEIEEPGHIEVSKDLWKTDKNILDFLPPKSIIVFGEPGILFVRKNKKRAACRELGAFFKKSGFRAYTLL